MARDPGAFSMSRRTFGRMLGVFFLAAPRIAMPQRATVVRRIGYLESGGPDWPEDLRRQAEALRAFGWVEGQNLHVERRYANGRWEALQSLAEELLRAKVEIIVTGGTAATAAAKRATNTVPIVFRAGDPVRSGLVASLAKPGGNVTGFSLNGPEINEKYLSILKELLPGLKRIGVLESTNPYWAPQRALFADACRAHGIEPVFVIFNAPGEIGNSIAQLARQRSQIIVLRADGAVFDHRFEIVEAAMKLGLPTMAEQSDIARDGGALISYAGKQADEFPRTARYVDRILRGAKPADLPVEQATSFELVFNLKTARALGLAIPQPLLLRADEVIQ